MSEESEQKVIDTEYHIQHGDRESIRLTAQHHLVVNRQGWLLHPKVEQAISSIANPQIVDIATGNGIWVLDAAQCLPQAHLTGLDIFESPFPPKWTWPESVVFKRFDVLDEVPEELHGKFDVAHVRLLLAGGGWLQWDEFTYPNTVRVFQPSPEHGEVQVDKSDTYPIVQFFDKQLGFRERLNWFTHFEEVARNHGFEEGERIAVPVKPSTLRTETENIITVYADFYENRIAKRGKKDPMMQELLKALRVMNQDRGKGVLFALNWNVGIAKAAQE